MDEAMQKVHNAHMLTVAQRVIDITEICEASWGNEATPASDVRTLEDVIAEHADTPYQAELISVLLNNGWNDAIRWALQVKKALN